jgi:hypothetical protein
MVLTKENYIEKIYSYTELDWKPLLDLIPEIIAAKEFGRIDEELDYKKTGVIHLSPYILSEITMKFLKIVYDIPIIIDFNWGSWDEGRKIASDEKFDFDTIDIPTKCKLITALVRNDRFCDGVLIEAFESGLIPKILVSIRNQLV